MGAMTPYPSPTVWQQRDEGFDSIDEKMVRGFSRKTTKVANLIEFRAIPIKSIECDKIDEIVSSSYFKFSKKKKIFSNREF